MKTAHKRWKILDPILVSLVFSSGCADKKAEPEVYLDEKDQDIVISLFTQDMVIAELIESCCESVINPDNNRNIILYSDAASFYGEEGLSYRELLLKRLESGQADDLYIIPAEDVMEFDSKGYIYDLSELPGLSIISEDALQQSTYNGKVFSAPLSYTGFGAIWNVDMLKEYGLEIPTNRAEFWSVCETLKENGILPYGANKDFGLSLPAMCAGLGPLYQDPRSDMLVDKLSTGEMPISAYMREGFTVLQTMVDKGYLDPARALETLPNSDEEIAFFKEGNCAFITAICRAKAFSYDYPFEVQMTALPLLEDGAICVVGADQRLAVNPKSEHLEETLLIVDNLCTVENLNALARQLGKTSSARGNEAATLPQADPLVACMAQGGQIPNQDFKLHFNTWNTIKELSVKICQGASVEDICQEYDALQLQEIEQYQSN